MKPAQAGFGSSVRKPYVLAIVGDGQVGLMLVLFIDWHGVRSVLFIVEKTTRWQPHCEPLPSPLIRRMIGEARHGLGRRAGPGRKQWPPISL